MKHQSRRSFLKKSAVLGVTGLVSGAAALALPAEPHLSFPTSPRDRLAVTTWQFRTYMESPTNRYRDAKVAGIGLKDFPAMVAKTFNLHNVELLGEHFPSTDAAYLQELRKAVEKAGSHIVNLPIGGRASFYDPLAVKRQEAVDYARHWVDVAVQVGSPSIRAHIAGVSGVNPDVDRTAESLAKLAAYGAQRNVLINLENDDLVTEDAFFLVKVIDKVANPYLRALPDFANSALGGVPEFNYDAMSLMFPHAYNIAHMKDSEVGDGDKLYSVDVARIFRIARAARYRGYFSLEWEGRAGPYEGTRKLMEESLKHLS